MTTSAFPVFLLLLSMCSATASSASERPAMTAVPSDPAPSVRKFEQAVDRTENLQLPLNKVLFYRQAAVALASTNKPEAVRLLQRALADIDAAEVAMRASGTLDDKTYQLMEFHRLPTIMLMERIDSAEALRVLAPPQTADHDMAFQTLFFQRLGPANSELVREATLHKLDYGVTPAVIAGYKVLLQSDPGSARTLGTAVIARLANIDPASDPVAVDAAFLLVKLIRTDVGSQATRIVIDPGLLPAHSVHLLFDFIGKSFLASDNPEMLILGQKPSLYLGALDDYSPDTANDVRLLPFAAPDARSLIFTPDKPVVDAYHPDPASLTPEQQQQRAAFQAQMIAQVKETGAQTQLAVVKIHNTALPLKDRDNALFAAVDQANQVIALARSSAASLDQEAFRSGELEFYSRGMVTGVVDAVSLILQNYAAERPRVAEDAAQRLDGPEVQAEVGLQIAIKEMTGESAMIVIQPKKPAPEK